MGVQTGLQSRLTRPDASAIGRDGRIQAGQPPDRAAVARLGGVTRARDTQITTLLFLAPDLQEQLLFLPPVAAGRAPVLLRDL